MALFFLPLYDFDLYDGSGVRKTSRGLQKFAESVSEPAGLMMRHLSKSEMRVNEPP
jgi:hypothetical protein